MSRVGDLCRDGGLWVTPRIWDQRILIVSDAFTKEFATPYGMAEFDGGLSSERVVYCLLSELGYFANKADPKPDQDKIGSYTVRNYVEGLRTVLGDLMPWIEALEADLGFEGLEMGFAARMQSHDPFSTEFQLALLPNEMIWDELYRLIQEDAGK